MFFKILSSTATGYTKSKANNKYKILYHGKSKF